MIRAPYVFAAMLGAAALLACVGARAGALECSNWQTQHPTWLWCDDFEDDSALEKSYFEVDRAGGRFGVSADAPFGGQKGLKAVYAVGNEDAGDVKLSLGRTPVSPKLYPDKDFNDLYWRVYIKVAPGWVGNATKTSTAIIFTGSGWTEAAVGNVWEDSATGLSLGLDPISGVSGSTVVTTKFNDFAHFKWLGHQNASTQIYSSANWNRWFCVESRMKLNTPGQSDGVFSLWIDGKLEAQGTGLNWRGSYTQYGINGVFLLNWINGGPSQQQTRYMDNFVVATAPIGCATGTTVQPNPPTNVRAN